MLSDIAIRASPKCSENLSHLLWSGLMKGSRAPNGLTDRVKLRSCERPKARRGRMLDVFDRGATRGRDANPRFHDGRQTVHEPTPKKGRQVLAAPRRGADRGVA